MGFFTSMKIGRILAFALGETLLAWIGALEVLFGKCNACFRDSPQLLGLISLRNGYRDLCCPSQFVHPMIDDVCCVQASVHSAFRNVTPSMHF